MITPPMPPDEPQRLAALRSLDILDTPDEERFDRLTRLACRVFGVPAALITLVDEGRQWFKSRQGVVVAETPRAVSMCAHAILGEEMIVPDAGADPRFVDNPFVTGEPHIRFYAGRSLATPEGSRIGTLCIVDLRPRRLSADELQSLRDLAVLAEDEINVSRLSEAQRQLLAERDSYRRRAMIDVLTRGWNRAAIGEILERELARADREGSTLAVAMADIDHFKRVNDSCGHPAGDAVLRETARRIRASLRPYDAAGRYGGEEFLLVLPKCGRADGVALAERVRGAVSREPFETPEHQVAVTISIGVAARESGGHATGEALVRAADEALYRAKSGGRNRVELAP